MDRMKATMQPVTHWTSPMLRGGFMRNTA